MAAEDWFDYYDDPDEDRDEPVTCRYCSQAGLRWHLLADGWRLIDGGTNRMHTCPEYWAAKQPPATADEFEFISGVGKFFATAPWPYPKITGNTPTMIIIDEYEDMKPKLKTKTSKRKIKAPIKPKYFTVGVRFLQGPNLNRIYTFKVRKGAKIHLGQEVVAYSSHGASVCAVVRIDTVPQDTETCIDYKFLSHKVSPL